MLDSDLIRFISQKMVRVAVVSKKMRSIRVAGNEGIQNQKVETQTFEF